MPAEPADRGSSGAAKRRRRPGVGCDWIRRVGFQTLLERRFSPTNSTSCDLQRPTRVAESGHFTTKPEGEGTPLGLSISYGIVHRHNANMAVRTEPGKGTTFRVSLPIVQPAGLPEEVIGPA